MTPPGTAAWSKITIAFKPSATISISACLTAAFPASLKNCQKLPKTVGPLTQCLLFPKEFYRNRPNPFGKSVSMNITMRTWRQMWSAKKSMFQRTRTPSFVRVLETTPNSKSKRKMRTSSNFWSRKTSRRWRTGISSMPMKVFWPCCLIWREGISMLIDSHESGCTYDIQACYFMMSYQVGMYWKMNMNINIWFWKFDRITNENRGAFENNTCRRKILFDWTNCRVCYSRLFSSFEYAC